MMNSIVENAVLHLKEIGNTMKSLDESNNFRLDDIEHCDRIAECIQELEYEVKRLHEEYEAETIKASVYRHKLKNFPLEVQKEIEANVRAARDSNKDIIADLRQNLDTLTRSVQELRKREKEFDDQIEVMRPEKESLIERHELVIAGLNQKMALKADNQIKLNESRDLLREINKKIRDIEEQMIILKEQLVKEKAEARQEKARLEQNKYNTNAKAKNQEEINENKKIELDGILKVLDESNKALRVVYRENERLEVQINQVKVEIESGDGEFQKQKDLYDSLLLESLRLTNLDVQSRQDYADNKATIIRETKEAGEQAKIEAENLKVIKESSDQRREELRAVFNTYKELSASVEQIRKDLDEMREDISKKVLHMTEMESKNLSVHEELDIMQDSHNVVMDSMQRELEELREQLTYERESRQQKQIERETKLTEIEKFNVSTTTNQSDAIKYMTDSKVKHKSLTEKERTLGDDLVRNEVLRAQLKSQVDELTSKYDAMKASVGGVVDKMESECVFYDSEKAKFMREIDELMPAYEELCRTFAADTKDYDDVRQLLISTKTHKANLEAKIKKTKQETIDHDLARDRLALELREKRNVYLEQMKKQSKELESVENEILQTGLRMQTVKFENEKFIQSIQEFEREFKHFEELGSENIQDIETFQSEYNRLHRELLDGWKDDHDIERLFETEDLDLVQRLASLLSLTNKRENNVSNVTNKLHDELENMSKYLRKMVGNQNLLDNENEE